MPQQWHAVLSCLAQLWLLTAACPTSKSFLHSLSSASDIYLKLLSLTSSSNDLHAS